MTKKNTLMFSKPDFSSLISLLQHCSLILFHLYILHFSYIFSLSYSQHSVFLNRSALNLPK